MQRWSWGLAVAWVAWCACGDEGGDEGIGLGMRGCLTDSQICQFEQGVSTPDDVQAALGNAQQYLGSETFIYVCQQIAGPQVIHNDLVVFDFYDGVLDDVTVLRQGTGATPPPDCEATGSGGADACASVPRWPQGGAACSSVVFGSVTVSTTCTAGDETWTSMCDGASCSCSYNEAFACACTVTDGLPHCCPGLPGAPP